MELSDNARLCRAQRPEVSGAGNRRSSFCDRDWEASLGREVRDACAAHAWVVEAIAGALRESDGEDLQFHGRQRESDALSVAAAEGQSITATMRS